LGKALLATCNDTDLERLVSQQSFDSRTPRTISDPEALLREVSRIRRQGFAIDMAENERGVHCIGAAVLGRRGEGIAAVSVSGPAERITRKSIDDHAVLVMMAAQAMGAELGPTNARRTPE
ncbi:MAG: IclR family transcriptional regulator, partial [Actinomycetota bacterium]